MVATLERRQKAAEVKAANLAKLQAIAAEGRFTVTEANQWFNSIQVTRSIKGQEELGRVLMLLATRPGAVQSR